MTKRGDHIGQQGCLKVFATNTQLLIVLVTNLTWDQIIATYTADFAHRNLNRNALPWRNHGNYYLEAAFQEDLLYPIQAGQRGASTVNRLWFDTFQQAIYDVDLLINPRR